MSNPRYNAAINSSGGDAKTASGQKGGGASGDMPMKTAKWPGLPGGVGPNRAAGQPKLKNAHSTAEGI